MKDVLAREYLAKLMELLKELTANNPELVEELDGLRDELRLAEHREMREAVK